MEWTWLTRTAVTFRRLVRKPVTLSDGYQLERGQQIALLARSIHMDEENVPDAATFKPDRWLKQQNSAPTSFSNSSTANLNFGLGRYACPGRFLASVCDSSVALLCFDPALLIGFTVYD